MYKLEASLTYLVSFILVIQDQIDRPSLKGKKNKMKQRWTQPYQAKLYFKEKLRPVSGKKKKKGKNKYLKILKNINLCLKLYSIKQPLKITLAFREQFPEFLCCCQLLFSIARENHPNHICGDDIFLKHRNKINRQMFLHKYYLYYLMYILSQKYYEA